MAVLPITEEYKPLQKLQKCDPRKVHNGVEFFKQGSRVAPNLATFGHDHIKLWNISTFDEEIDISEKTSNGKISSWRCGIQSYDVAENGKLIVVLGVESTLFIISIATNGQYTTEQFNNGLMAMWFIRISPDHETFLTANFSGSLQLLDRKAQVVKSVPFDKVKQISAIEYSCSGKYVAAGNSHGWISMLDGQTLVSVYQIEGHSMKIRCLAFTLDEQNLLSGSDDRTIKLYSLTDSKGYLCATFVVTRAVCSPSALTNPQLERGLQSVDFIRCLAFYPDGRFLVAGTDDSTIFTYKMPQPDNYIEEEEEMAAEDEQEQDTSQQMLSHTDTDAENHKYYPKQDDNGQDGYNQPSSIENNQQESPLEQREQDDSHKMAFEDEETGFYPQISGQPSAINNSQSSIPDSQALAIDTQYDSQMPHLMDPCVPQDAGQEHDEKMDESDSQPQQPVNYQEEFERRELERELGID
uniref:Uncharacterized protein n=1 Tax=Ditylenchus dipsaci TaxID=166011 RepID=A0A915ECI1_9BILA